MLRHGLIEALYVAVNVLVEQRQEEAEILRVPLMRRGRHQEIVVRHLGQGLTQLVGEGFLVGAVSAHFVGFVDDDQIPVAPQQRFLRVIHAGNPRNGSDDLVFLLPRIHPVVGAEHVAADHLEALPELVLEFPLPLERQIGGRHDKRSLHQSTYFEFLDKEARHDGFAGAWIIREQKPDAWKFYEIVVDRL